MAELKTKQNDASVEKFLAKQKDPQVRADCQALVDMMSKATGEPPRMWGGSIVGFGNWHYVYESGRTGDWFQTGFSPRKQSLTLYLMVGFAGREALLSTLGRHSTGVGCLYIKRLSDVHMPTLRTLIKKCCQAARKQTAEHARKAEAQAAARHAAVKQVVRKAVKRKAAAKAAPKAKPSAKQKAKAKPAAKAKAAAKPAARKAATRKTTARKPAPPRATRRR